jgi:hypothetical protein
MSLPSIDRLLLIVIFDGSKLRKEAFTPRPSPDQILKAFIYAFVVFMYFIFFVNTMKLGYNEQI